MAVTDSNDFMDTRYSSQTFRDVSGPFAMPALIGDLSIFRHTNMYNIYIWSTAGTPHNNINLFNITATLRSNVVVTRLQCDSHGLMMEWTCLLYVHDRKKQPDKTTANLSIIHLWDSSTWVRVGVDVQSRKGYRQIRGSSQPLSCIKTGKAKKSTMLYDANFGYIPGKISIEIYWATHKLLNVQRKKTYICSTTCWILTRVYWLKFETSSWLTIKDERIWHDTEGD